MNMLLRLLWTWLRARSRGGVPALGPAVTPFRVNPGDLDVLMHVNNGRYLSIMDVARIDLMLRSGLWRGIRARGWYPVVSAQTIDFARSLTLGQRFTVTTRVIGWDERAIYLSQDFHTPSEAVDARPVAKAIVQARFLGPGGARVPAAEIVALGSEGPASPPLPDWVVDWARAQRERRAG